MAPPIGECNNKDCQFMHVDADSLKVKDCPWYDRGFCKHGEEANYLIVNDRVVPSL